MSNVYTTAKSARRAARKQGHDVFEIEQHDGMFSFVVPSANNENEPEIVETVEIDNEDQGEVEGDVPATVEYVLPNEDRPVAFVWAFLALNRDKAERKILIRAMIDMGYNSNMVKTQTSRFYSVDGDKDAYLSIEKMKRDAAAAHIAELAAQIKADREAAEADEKRVSEWLDTIETDEDGNVTSSVENSTDENIVSE